jgi:Arc/MetJ-type ribon-helix-helix transcriptional regulator
MLPSTDTLHLPPELEHFAAEAVAAGRYSDVSAVVQTRVRAAIADTVSGPS